jgi:superfamily II DNA helicase RecQ
MSGNLGPTPGARTLAEQVNVNFELKDEQIELLRALSDQKHTFGILPTGFGKSMSFILIPFIMDKVSYI